MEPHTATPSPAKPGRWARLAAYRPDRLAIGMVCFASLIVIGMWVAVESLIAREREAKIGEVMKENANLARIFEEHTQHTIAYADEILLGVKSAFEANPRRFDLPAYFKSRRPNAAIVRNSVITDANGQVIMGSHGAPRISLADREHIKFHLETDTHTLFISKPVLARVNQQWSVVATRRANNKNGLLAGTVGVAIDPEYFSGFYRDIDLGENGSVTLVGTDGIVRARRAREGSAPGQDLSGNENFQHIANSANLPYTTFVTRSSIDGIERIFAAQRVRDYPLLVFVGTSTNEALAETNIRATNYRLNAAAASAMVLLICLALLIILQREHRARLRLVESEKDLLDAQRIGHLGHWQLDMASRRITWSEELYRIFGQNAALPPPHFSEHPELFTTQSWERLTAARAGLRDTGIPYEIELQIVKPDGEHRWALLRSEAVRGANGAMVGLRGAVMDITERKQAEAARESLAGQLNEAQKREAVSSLAGDIAHHFNNNLAAILGNAELAIEDARGGKPELLESLREIQIAGNQARDLVRKLVSANRLPSNQPNTTQIAGLAPAKSAPAAATPSIVQEAGPTPITHATSSVPTAQTLHPASPPQSAKPGGRHVLYLDDDQALGSLVKRQLTRRGLQVSVFFRQAEALAALRADPAAFDLVVSDYNMPGMSGLEVAREVRAIRADLPVALASGFMDDGLRAKAVEAGVRQVIFKAEAVEDFCEVVMALLPAPG